MPKADENGGEINEISSAESDEPKNIFIKRMKGTIDMPILYVVLPCYNEEAVLPETTRRLTEKLSSMISSGVCDEKSRILYVDDGSKDKTWELIEKFHGENHLVCGVNLPTTAATKTPLLAGLMTAKEHCDCAASMDADLQDDINVLDGFMENSPRAATWYTVFAASAPPTPPLSARRLRATINS